MLWFIPIFATRLPWLFTSNDKDKFPWRKNDTSLKYQYLHINFLRYYCTETKEQSIQRIKSTLREISNNEKSYLSSAIKIYNKVNSIPNNNSELLK